MSKDNFTFDNYREDMKCPMCGGKISATEYVCNDGICDNCWEKAYSEFEIYDWREDDE